MSVIFSLCPIHTLIMRYAPFMKQSLRNFQCRLLNLFRSKYVSTLCSLQIEEHCPWVFDGSFDCLQCCNCFPSINETMIVCQSDIHHWPYNNLKISIRHKFNIIFIKKFPKNRVPGAILYQLYV